MIYLYFNSIKVQLELYNFDSDFVDKNFNSIKVQLEHSEFKTSYDRYKFQFHKGTIRTGRTIALRGSTI